MTRPPTARPGIPVTVPARLARFELPGEVLDAIIGGGSALDLPRLAVSDRASAMRFLHRYGYDLDEPAHRAAVERVRHEALGFMRGVLLHSLGLPMPTDFDSIEILDLLMQASRAPDQGDRAEQLQQAWSCAMLRVMHAVAHADNFFQHNYYRQIRESILERFVALVKTLPDGSQVLAGATFDVPLVRFEVKQQKPLRSVVLKLLHKRENVAADLFDHIGVRIIVRRPADALLAVCALHEQHAILYANVKPTRSHNTLIDVDAFGAKARQLVAQCKAGALDADAAVAMLAAFETRPDRTEPVAWNAHSSRKYKSIQFTCRQMIRFANPLHRRLARTRKIARRHLDGDALQEVLDATSLLGVESDIQFFFPYEVQIMDIASYAEAIEGRAAYAEYKDRQVDSVRERVFGRLLRLANVEVPARVELPLPMAPQPLASLIDQA